MWKHKGSVLPVVNASCIVDYAIFLDSRFGFIRLSNLYIGFVAYTVGEQQLVCTVMSKVAGLVSTGVAMYESMRGKQFSFFS